jgi:DNA polymerase-1
MSILELARKAYAKIKSELNGNWKDPAHRFHPASPSFVPLDPSHPNGNCEKSEESEISQNLLEIKGLSEEAPGQEMREKVARGPDGAKKDASAPFELVTDSAGLGTVAAAISESTLIGVDTETTGLDCHTDRVRLLSLDLDTNGGRFTYLVDCFEVDPSPLWEALADKPLVLHHAAFDLAFLFGLGFTPAGPVHDTMLLAQLLAAGTYDKVSLEAVAGRELGRDLDKKHQKSDWSRLLTPAQLRYAADDAGVLVPLFRSLSTQIKAANLERVADIERRCLPAVVWTARNGVAFDRAAWDVLAATAQADAERLAVELNAAAPRRPGSFGFDTWNWDSPVQVKEAFAAASVKVENTADETLATISHPLAALLRQYRDATKRMTTYGRDWTKCVAKDGRVYADWRQIGAASGRMACREPNLQNLPRDPAYRRCFRAPHGRVLVKADYSQIELRIAAKLSDDKALSEAYQRSEDLHTRTARMVLGKHDVTKQDRQLAKALNFGLLYGMGSARLRDYARTEYGIALTKSEACAYRAAFFRTYPGLAAWHRKAGATGYTAMDTRTLAGRRRVNVQRFTEKLNTPDQGTGADGLKAALGLLWERRAECPGAFPVLIVHDEIVVEADENQADAAGRWLKRAMVDGMAPLIEPVPVAVAVTTAPTWGGEP